VAARRGASGGGASRDDGEGFLSLTGAEGGGSEAGPVSGESSWRWAGVGRGDDVDSRPRDDDRGVAAGTFNVHLGAGVGVKGRRCSTTDDPSLPRTTTPPTN